MKTAELTGAALDWAVAKCAGIPKLEDVWEKLQHSYLPSTDWAQGGPIIERECFELVPVGVNTWAATSQYIDGNRVTQYGPTPLITAMRCYVASKLGDEVDVPTELTSY